MLACFINRPFRTRFRQEGMKHLPKVPMRWLGVGHPVASRPPNRGQIVTSKKHVPNGEMNGKILVNRLRLIAVMPVMKTPQQRYTMKGSMNPILHQIRYQENLYQL